MEISGTNSAAGANEIKKPTETDATNKTVESEPTKSDVKNEDELCDAQFEKNGTISEEEKMEIEHRREELAKIDPEFASALEEYKNTKVKIEKEMQQEFERQKQEAIDAAQKEYDAALAKVQQGQTFLGAIADFFTGNSPEKDLEAAKQKLEKANNFSEDDLGGMQYINLKKQLLNNEKNILQKETMVIAMQMQALETLKLQEILEKPLKESYKELTE